MGTKTTILGCGLMGSAIARTLHAKGHSVASFNRSPGPLGSLETLGIKTSTNIDTAIEGAGTIVCVLSNYEAVRSVLNAVAAGNLTDKLVINLTSGSALDAKEMAQWMAAKGVEYLDGSIWVLPSMIGEPETVITCGGSSANWRKAEAVIKALGGSSFHSGENVESANVLEACFPGTFYMTAQSCFIEAVELATKSRIELNVVARSIAPSLRLLRNSLDDLVSRIENDYFEATDVTLDVIFHAAAVYKQTATSADVPTPYLNLLLEQLSTAQKAGSGRLAAAALVKRT